MKRLMAALFVASICAVGLTGCGGGELPQVETVEAPVISPIDEAKSLLQNYANGQPVTSEAESFADIATRAKDFDDVKGALIEQGFNQIKANPAAAQSIASGLLKQL